MISSSESIIADCRTMRNVNAFIMYNPLAHYHHHRKESIAAMKHPLQHPLRQEIVHFIVAFIFLICTNLAVAKSAQAQEIGYFVLSMVFLLGALFYLYLAVKIMIEQAVDAYE